MANPEHVRAVKKGPEAIDEWLEQHPETRWDLSGGHLRKVFLSGTDLRGANLCGVNLSGANLSGTNLSGANLICARLREADAHGATLRAASLIEADLRAANLREADLRAASLIKADLRAADLSKADLSGADLTKAQCSETVFLDVDLSSVKGLDTVKHWGRSTLGEDTLYESRGRVPEAFLRGCGVPEAFITHLRSPAGERAQYYSCFISYSHADKSFARRLHDALQGRGIRCWLDEHQMLPGDDIYEQVDRGVRLWDKILLCASKDSLTSWWVDNEVESAFKKEQQLMKDRGVKVLALIPLDLDGYLFSDDWKRGYKTQVLTRLAADFKGWESDNAKFERELEKVVKALQSGPDPHEPPPESKL